MAKRYKKREKKQKLKIILPIIIVLLIAVVVINKEKIFNIREEVGNEGVKTIQSEEEEIMQEIEVSRYQELNCNMLDIMELKEETEKILQELLEEKILIKINYKLRKLDEGSIFLEYLLEENEKEIVALKIKIDINGRKIEKIQKIRRNNKIKEEILNNLSEDIQEDYKLKQEELNKKNNSYVNVIITEKEIIINLAIEN